MDQLDYGIAVHPYAGIQMWTSWTMGLQSIPTQVYKCGPVGLWDCSPSLRRHTNVDQLDYGIAVHPYAGIQMRTSWTMGLQFIPTQAYKCGPVGLWDCSSSLRRYTDVDQLDYGIAVHPYAGIQMWTSWTMGLQSIPTQVYKCGPVGLWDCSP